MIHRLLTGMLIGFCVSSVIVLFFKLLDEWLKATIDQRLERLVERHEALADRDH